MVIENGNSCRVFFRTLSHGKSKIEIRQRNRKKAEKKSKWEKVKWTRNNEIQKAWAYLELTSPWDHYFSKHAVDALPNEQRINNICE